MLLYPNISLCSLQVLQATATWWWWYMYFLSHKRRNKLVCCQLLSLWCVQVQLVLEIQVTWGKIKVSLHCCWVFDVCLVFRGSRGSFEDHFEAATINQWVASCQLLDNPFSSRQIFAEELWVLLNTYSLGSRLRDKKSDLKTALWALRNCDEHFQNVSTFYTQLLVKIISNLTNNEKHWELKLYMNIKLKMSTQHCVYANVMFVYVTHKQDGRHLLVAF